MAFPTEFIRRTRSRLGDEAYEALEKALLLRNNKSNYEEIIDEYSSKNWCEKVIGIYYKIIN